MLPVGHTSAGYILARVPELFGYHLSLFETLAVVVSANLPDFDFIYIILFGKNDATHRNYITHTPVGVIIMWVLLKFALGNIISSVAFFMIMAGTFSHIVLDSFAYWFTLIGWQDVIHKSQIRWRYPFGAQIKNEASTKYGGLANYIKKARVNLFIEATLTAISVYLLVN